MANFLFIESWVRSVGLIMPERLKALGHRFTFVSRKPEHYTNWAKGAGIITAERHPLIALADEVVVAETNDAEALVAALAPVHRERRFDGVLTTCDYYLVAVAQVAQALGLPGASPEALATTRHKHRMRQVCQRAGLPGPRFCATEQVEEALACAADIGFPVIIKAVDLSGSEHVYAVHDPEQLRRACAQIHHEAHNIRGQSRPPVVLVEEMLRGQEFSVETCTFGGITKVIGITDKSLIGYPHFIESGFMHPADIPASDARLLGDFVCQALAAVGYSHGLAHTEVKLTADGPRIIEINPRMGGSYIYELVELVTGIDLFAASIDLALGREPDMTGRQTGVASAAACFLAPPRGGQITAIHGAEDVRGAPGIHRVMIGDVIGKSVRQPEDNNDLIGYVIALDHQGRGARQRAEWATQQIEICMS